MIWAERSKKNQYWKVLLVLMILTFCIKLIWFEPVFNQEYAFLTAREKLESLSKTYLFDINQFKKPTSISGNNEDGYLFSWDFISTIDASKLSVVIGVSRLADKYSGDPFILDCRRGTNANTWQGFAYLCNQW